MPDTPYERLYEEEILKERIMGKYNSEDASSNRTAKNKVRKFRDYHDEELNHEDRVEFFKKNKKKGRQKRKNQDLPDFE